MRMNRRQFIQSAALAASAAAIGGCASAYPSVAKIYAAKRRDPKEKLNIGAVGVGGKGMSDWFPMAQRGENIVALCDVDSGAVNAGLAALKGIGVDTSKVKQYSDWRKMLAECGKDLDAVTVSTPDHTHAPAAIRAMEMGCNVYVQKPLVRTIWEAHYFEKVAKACGVITQMGNQGSAEAGLRRNVDILRSGILGNVTAVYVWTDRPIWPQGQPHPQGKDAVPASLNWDAWLGTAPFRDYKADTYHTFKWRGFYDFGTGAFGDMACHTLNLPIRGLSLGAAESAECIQLEGKSDDEYPSKSIVKVRYSARGSQPACDLYWYDGNQRPSADIMPVVVANRGEVPATGLYVQGDKGCLFVQNDHGAEGVIALNGEKKMLSTFKHPACVAVPETWKPAMGDHNLEFTNACKGIEKACSDIDHSIPMVEGILVGCIAQRVPGKLLWDSKRQSFDNPLANQYIKPFIREGWEF
jgi:predicted dehydrogenase